MNEVSSPPAAPVKTREMHNHHFDSTMWNGFAFRPDDIIIASYAKSGTTWTQQIVSELVFDGNPPGSVGDISPWVDLRVPPREVKLPNTSTWPVTAGMWRGACTTTTRMPMTFGITR